MNTKHLMIALAFVLSGLSVKAQVVQNSTSAKDEKASETAIRQEPKSKTVKREVVNPDGTKTMVEEKVVEEKKVSPAPAPATRMAINEKGIPTSGKPVKKDVKKEEKPASTGSTINSKGEDKK
ncbi:MAG: hypothetical protein QM534_05315 [Sediminibacterium sp.]|nr:hypothetical protein [Sediminibacterium sp.]